MSKIKEAAESVEKGKAKLAGREIFSLCGCSSFLLLQSSPLLQFFLFIL